MNRPISIKLLVKQTQDGFIEFDAWDDENPKNDDIFAICVGKDYAVNELPLVLFELGEYIEKVLTDRS